MKFGLILDNSSLTAWQADALAQIKDNKRFTLYNCTNSRRGRRSLKHILYYMLNFVSLRTRRTKRISLPHSLRPEQQFDFECEYDGAWERLPQWLLKLISEDPPEFIIKFGMGLLRIPAIPELAVPVLSYHHGDPSAFRGRPAGFYEMLLGEKTLGQVVQILSNRLDGGRIVAFGETKIQHQSYRATMKEAYRCSQFLLPQAIRNTLEGNEIAIATSGTVYRLPSGLTVMRFVMQRLKALLKHLAYGAFYEKAWAVAETQFSIGKTPLRDFPCATDWRSVTQPKGYRFLADPFYHPHGDGLLVEGLNSASGVGDILHISRSGPRVLLSGNGHYSFPSTVRVGDEDFVVPEVSDWSSPLLFKLDKSSAAYSRKIKIPSGLRLLDPTLFLKENTIYLFANVSTEGSSVLRLWYANSILSEFTEHPESPVLISPAGARMAGMIIKRGKNYYRLGQNYRDSYGNGIMLFRIHSLSRSKYRESWCDELRFEHCRGPHTLNSIGDSVVFDQYVDRFSIVSGVRRLRAYWSRARPDN